MQLLTHKRKTENGLTNPTERGKADAFSNPTSLEVNKELVGARASSCPEKCIAMDNAM